MQMFDSLEHELLLFKDRQPLSTTKVHPETHLTTTPGLQLPDTRSDNIKLRRRKVTRHTSADHRNISEAQTPVDPDQEGEVSLMETRHRETTLELTSAPHKGCSRGKEEVSQPPIHPQETDSSPAAPVQETQRTDSFVPLWDVEPEPEHVPTSPFTDLSCFFPDTPKEQVSSIKKVERTKQTTKPGAETVSSNRNLKVNSKNQDRAPVTPKRSTKSISPVPTPNTNLGREIVEKGQTSSNTLPSSRKVYSPTRGFSSPSTDFLSRPKHNLANVTYSGRTLKGTVKNGLVYYEKEAGSARPRSKTSTTPPLADDGVSGKAKKPTSTRTATRGILKNAIPTKTKKHGVEAAELQADDAAAASGAKRLKRGAGATTNSLPAKSPSSSAPKQSASISGRNRHQHPYRLTAKSGSFSNRRRRSQTTEGDLDQSMLQGSTDVRVLVDRYELRFRQELA